MEYHVHYSPNEELKINDGDMEDPDRSEKNLVRSKKLLYINLTIAVITIFVLSFLLFGNFGSKGGNMLQKTDTQNDTNNDDYIIKGLLKSKNGKKFIISKLEELIVNYDNGKVSQEQKEDPMKVPEKIMNHSSMNKMMKLQEIKEKNAQHNNIPQTNKDMHKTEKQDFQHSKNISYENLSNVTFLLENLEAVSAFDSFLKTFEKKYESSEEMHKRFSNFMKNYREVVEHNKTNDYFKKKINQFSDHSPEELRMKFLNLKKSSIPVSVKGDEMIKNARRFSEVLIKYKMEQGDTSGERIFAISQEKEDPETISFDWREKKGVTHIKDQGNCGSCWAFSVVGTIESQYAIRKNSMLSLSEQQLLDCSSRNNGCDGGTILYAFEYIKEAGGVCADKEYPYMQFQEETCNKDKCSVRYPIEYIHSIPEDKLKEAIRYIGPISVNVAVADDFIFYDSGIFNGECEDIPNHAVMIVGYGVEEKFNSKKKINEKIYYYIIKNSWGDHWGEKGFMRIITDEKGTLRKCDLGEEAFIALVA